MIIDFISKMQKQEQEVDLDYIYSVEKMRTGFGTDISECQNFDEILETSGTNWTVGKIPLFTGDGRQVEGAYAIQRDIDHRILCPAVTGMYAPFQQEQFRDIANGLMNQGAEPVLGGSFYGGKKVWYQFQMPDQEIMGDNHRHYLYLMNSHDTSGSVIIMTSLLRIACSNGINMLMKNAVSQWRYRHSGDLDVRVAEAKQAIMHANQYVEAYREAADTLQHQTVTGQEVNDFIEQLFPFPKVAEGKELSDRQILTVAEKRARMQEIIQNKDDLCMLGNTKFKLLQAAADYVSHPVFSKHGKNTEERYVETSMSGHPLLNRAYSLLVA